MEAGITAKARFYQGLGFKLVFGLVVALLLASSPFFYLLYSRHRAKLITQRIEFATSQSNLIKASLRHSMLTHDRGELQAILDALGHQGGLVDVFILDKTGTVWASQQPADVGTQLDLQERTCQLCHSQEPKNRSRTVLFRDESRREFLRTVNLIENDPQCHNCHPPEQSINGVIVTDFSIADLNLQALADLREFILVSLAGIAVTGIATSLVLRYLVLTRLKGLVRATRRLGQGDLDQRVEPRGRDELDELLNAFNAMAAGLKRRTEELTRAREEIARKAAQLQDLLARMTRIQEEERGRIAHDMHDGLIQLIAGALFESQSAKERLNSDPQSAMEKLTVVQRLLSQMEGEVRRTIHNLHPPYLDQAGLIQAVQKCTDSFQEMWGIPCKVQIKGDPKRLPPHAEVAIYRIIQEALVNIGTHSGAQRAHVILDYDQEAFKAMVQDDGRGFDWQKALANPGKHLGLIGMKERAESLGGRLEIRSAPGQGTTLLVEVPLDHLGGEGREEDRST